MTDIKIRHRLWRCEYGFCCDYEPFVYGGANRTFCFLFCQLSLCVAKVLQKFGIHKTLRQKK